MLEDFWADAASKNSGFGVLLTVGFLPGLQVEAIPLLRPRKVRSFFFFHILYFALAIGFIAFSIYLEDYKRKKEKRKVRSFALFRK